MIISAQSRNPILRMISSALRFLSAADIVLGNRNAAAYRRVSRTVNDGSNASSSCVTYEHKDRITEAEGDDPLNSMRPEELYRAVKELCRRRAIRLSNELCTESKL